MAIGPAGAFSWHAARAGKTAPIRSSASIRWMGSGVRRPPRNRSTPSERLRFHRHREANIGDTSTACDSTVGAVVERSSLAASPTGKLCWGPRESTTASSEAAAWSSKSKVAQKRFRRARPKARLTRPPNGAWTTSWVPPASSKNRSNTRSRWVGSTPRAARPAARYSTSWRAAAASMPHRSATAATTASSRSGPAPAGSRPISSSTSDRSSET